MSHARWTTTRATREPAGGEHQDLYDDARLADELAQKVYDRRMELGLSQTEVADRAGMKQPQISRIEGGGTVPTLPLLRRLAKALEMELHVGFTIAPAGPPMVEPASPLEEFLARVADLKAAAGPAGGTDTPAARDLASLLTPAVLAAVPDLASAAAVDILTAALLQVRVREEILRLVAQLAHGVPAATGEPWQQWRQAVNDALTETQRDVHRLQDAL
jgi:transcriptional regulator with XRE-family HTH domain